MALPIINQATSATTTPTSNAVSDGATDDEIADVPAEVLCFLCNFEFGQRNFLPHQIAHVRSQIAEQITEGPVVHWAVFIHSLHVKYLQCH
jgi:hypothetical protein